MTNLDYYEFFAGGGMARLGLGKRWRCVFANDYDENKASTYRANFTAASELRVCDIAELVPDDLPGRAALAWASFPCQDLSLAGAGVGLRGTRSGTFWPFWKLMLGLANQRRAPHLIVLENVYGTLTSHDGRDFTSICRALTLGGYRCGALVVDAVRFVPQSRPRLFIVAVLGGHQLPEDLLQSNPGGPFHVPAVVAAYERLPRQLQREWIWWKVAAPRPRTLSFTDIIEEQPTGVEWHTPEETAYLLSLMSAHNRKKVDEATQRGYRVVGTVYRRTRRESDGRKVQRAEVRFDQIAGCLRTPAGGSSRQTILVVEGREIRSRLLSPREAARLMGLPDTYCLPTSYNAAYHIAGDGVVVPVVSHLRQALIEPLIGGAGLAARINAA